MRLLIIGGTIFVGRHLVEIATARGHRVTLFNRGRSAPELFTDLERVRGDRDGGLGALAGRTWDAAIDTCGYVPRIVRASAEYLSGAVRHYTFISSLSVYRDLGAPAGETAPVGTLDDPTVEQITGGTYGPLKALCEQAVEAALPGGALIVRPGLIVGPHDPTDRFTYWPLRVARGGEVLAPGRPDAVTQIIDVRDLAAWIVDMIEAGKTGVYNATGPEKPFPMETLLSACREITGADARFEWVEDRFLVEKNVEAFREMPLWIPGVEMQFDCRKAIADGLRFRPLAETIRDTLAWAATRSGDHALRAGLKPEREVELLSEWSGRP
jgi:2'-hydroxyisoflavone reductase